MTDIDNGVGETIPDDVDVRLVFNTQGTLVDCDAPRGSWPDTWQAVGATMGTEAMYDRWACVARDPLASDRVNTLAQTPPTFVYLDCGRWGGNPPRGQRNFGLVWGTWAALCNFVPRSGPAVTVDPAAQPLNDVVASLTGANSSVRLVKKLWTPAPIAPDWNTVYVFIPDLHLPIVRRMPESTEYMGQSGNWREYVSDGPAMGRYQYRARNTDDEGMVYRRDGSAILGTNAQTWFRRYLAGDIFQGAADDLTQFATLLGQSTIRNRIHLVQIGDMYDYWIGLDRYFEEQSAHRVVLRRDGDGSNRTAHAFVDYWTRRTNDLFPRMISALTTAPVAQKSWLWGNHDNYLAAYTPPGLPRRVREIRRGGVFVEHGQRGDPQNRDGAVSGHSTTNDVFENASMRAWDPQRRDYFVTTAAISYAYNPDFGIYVMGHTHSPFLSRVRLRVTQLTPLPAETMRGPRF